MSEQIRWNVERLAALLGLLKPAPAGWVEAAAELPRLRSTLDTLVARAEVDAELRAALVADLEAALAAEGIEPTPRLLAELRDRLQH
ncbi:MAG: hypothetical protein ACYDA3_06920 [Gaiellaceae bacterium]